MDKNIKLNFGKIGEYIVGVPTVGQFMEIENLKIALTDGKYGDIVRQNVKLSNMDLDYIDAISNFSVLIKDFSYSKMLNSNIFDAKIYSDVFKKQFAPWLNDLINQLQTYGDEEQN